MRHVNHPYLQQVAHVGLALPGAKRLTRTLVRHLIQTGGLSRKNRQRLYNFFAGEVSPGQWVNCATALPQGGSLRLRLNLEDDLSRTWYFWGYQGYELGMISLLSALLPARKVVVEAGANIGYYSLLMASLVGEAGLVYAFEPWPAVADYLQCNAQLNRMDNLRLSLSAVSDQDGRQTLFLPANFAWTNASLITGFTQQQKQVTVPTCRLDTFCAQQGLTTIDLLKIDVEGAELMVLEGLGNRLHQWQPDIICEVLPPYAAELDSFFQATPYRKFLITNEGLEEKANLRSHPHYRDYYLTCQPPAALGIRSTSHAQ